MRSARESRSREDGMDRAVSQVNEIGERVALQPHIAESAHSERDNNKACALTCDSSANSGVCARLAGRDLLVSLRFLAGLAGDVYSMRCR